MSNKSFCISPSTNSKLAGSSCPVASHAFLILFSATRLMLCRKHFVAPPLHPIGQAAWMSPEETANLKKSWLTQILQNQLRWRLQMQTSASKPLSPTRSSNVQRPKPRRSVLIPTGCCTQLLPKSSTGINDHKLSTANKKIWRFLNDFVPQATAS